MVVEGQLQIHMWVILFDLNLGSTVAVGPSVFHFSSLCWWWWWDGPLQLQSPLCLTSDDCGDPIQIHICVVLFDQNLGGGEGIHSGSSSGPISVSPELIVYIDIVVTLCYLQSSTFCPITAFQVVIFEKFLPKQGSVFPDDHFEYHQPYVIFRIECFVP